MGSVTAIVRSAILELGVEAVDKDVKAYIRQNFPDVPQGQINLALRKIRSERPQSWATQLASKQSQFLKRGEPYALIG